MKTGSAEPCTGKDSFALQEASDRRRDPGPSVQRILSQQSAFGPEEIRAILTAYEAILRDLDLVRREDLATKAIARKILEFAMPGECEPARLRDLVLKWIRQ